LQFLGYNVSASNLVKSPISSGIVHPFGAPLNEMAFRHSSSEVNLRKLQATFSGKVVAFVGTLLGFRVGVFVLAAVGLLVGGLIVLLAA
jgi:hypothetical protein